jgi:tetratricopeptide (TPR) repeat protein
MKTSKRVTNLVFWLILSQLSLVACSLSSPKETMRDSENKEIENILQSTGLKVASVEDALLEAEKASQSGKMDLAQLYYIKAHDMEPTDIQVLQKMADLYIELKKYELAEVSFKLILKQQPDDLKTVEQYGLLLIKLRNYQEAEENLSRVIAKQQSWRAYNGLGIIANLQGDPLKAESFFKEAVNIFPDSPELLNNTGFALYSANKLDEAGTYYLKALQINPDFKKAIYNHALLQARLKNYQQAYMLFVKVTSAEEANNNTGYIAMMNGDYVEAHNYLQEAIKVSPRYYKKANDNLIRLESLEKQ